MHKIDFGRAFPPLLRPGDVVIDVGAGPGAASRLALQHGASCVIALEPDRRYPMVPGTDWLQVAAGDAFTADAVLYLAKTATQNSLLAELVPQQVDIQERTPVVMLDTIAAHADVIKIDAQGWDAKVMRGGRRLVSTARVLVVEVWPHGLRRAGDSVCDLFALVTAAGFTRITWGDGDSQVTADECAQVDAETSATRFGDWIATR